MEWNCDSTDKIKWNEHIIIFIKNTLNNKYTEWIYGGT